jgi:hypothetical protein
MMRSKLLIMTAQFNSDLIWTQAKHPSISPEARGDGGFAAVGMAMGISSGIEIASLEY